MPIGTGYSSEKQITGREDLGGLQLEVSLEVDDLYLSHEGWNSLEMTRSPADWGQTLTSDTPGTEATVIPILLFTRGGKC